MGVTIREIPNNPTSFIAEFGSGHPILGITGEYSYAKEFTEQLSPSVKRSVMNTYFAPAEVEAMDLSGMIVKNIDDGKLMCGSTDVGDQLHNSLRITDGSLLPGRNL